MQCLAFVVPLAPHLVDLLDASEELGLKLVQLLRCLGFVDAWHPLALDLFALLRLKGHSLLVLLNLGGHLDLGQLQLVHFHLEVLTGLLVLLTLQLVGLNLSL